MTITQWHVNQFIADDVEDRWSKVKEYVKSTDDHYSKLDKYLDREWNPDFDKSLAVQRMWLIHRWKMLPYVEFHAADEDDFKLPGMKKSFGDCVARALASAGTMAGLEGYTYRELYDVQRKMLSHLVTEHGVPTNSPFPHYCHLRWHHYWRAVDTDKDWLEALGWRYLKTGGRHKINDKFLAKYVPPGRTAVALINAHHTIAIVEGKVVDTWDSRFHHWDTKLNTVKEVWIPPRPEDNPPKPIDVKARMDSWKAKDFIIESYNRSAARMY